MNKERRAYWRKLIAEQEASGMTIHAFCKQRGLGHHSFYHWRKRLQKNEPVQFALLKTVGSSGAPLEVFLPGGERLCIPNGVDTTTLRGVLDALRS
jgi:hypothetical protein